MWYCLACLLCSSQPTGSSLPVLESGSAWVVVMFPERTCTTRLMNMLLTVLQIVVLFVLPVLQVRVVDMLGCLTETCFLVALGRPYPEGDEMPRPCRLDPDVVAPEKALSPVPFSTLLSSRTPSPQARLVKMTGLLLGHDHLPLLTKLASPFLLSKR